MAAASYTTDLTTIATGDLNVDAGTWDESTNAGWDTGGAMVDDENLYYNNTECVSAQMTKLSNGTGNTGPATIMYEHTAAFTIPADGAALIHHMWAAPPALNTIDNATSAGINILAGTTLGDFYAWKASGSDFVPAPKGGWTNYAINPAIGTPDHTVGTITTYAMIGVSVSALAQARGNPNACNAVRYGRCTSIYTDGDVGNGYATFLGYGLVDAISTNKWSLLDPIEGGYKFQGLMSLGVTATSVDFRDANRVISIANTINVTPAFNAIEVHNASSNVEWTAINISALGTLSKGTFEVVDNATVNKDTCVFTDMDTFIYQSNSTILGSTYRRCGLVTQVGATFTDCTFDASANTPALLASDLGLITGTHFESAGTGHAMELSATGTYSWTDNTVNGYGATATTDAVIYNNSGGLITINVNGGATVGAVTYRNGTSASTVVQASFTLTLTDIPTNVKVTIVNSSTRTELQHTVSTGVDITYSHQGGETVDILLNSIAYDPNLSDIYDLTLDSGDQAIKFQMLDDLNYSNP